VIGKMLMRNSLQRPALRHVTLFWPLAVGSGFQPADKQSRQDVLGLIVRPDADPPATRRNLSMIVRRDIILAAVCGMHYEGQKWLSSQSIANILCHDLNLPKNL